MGKLKVKWHIHLLMDFAVLTNINPLFMETLDYTFFEGSGLASNPGGNRKTTKSIRDANF